MRPSWQPSSFAGRHERERDRFAKELELQGAEELAARVRACCRFVSISALDCCASEQRLLWNTCGVRGCPVCQHVAAKEEAAKLWKYAAHLRSTLPGRYWKHVVLTSPALADTSVRSLRRRALELKRATKKLWALMQAWEEPAAGARCYLEVNSSGMVHLHALVIAGWIDAAWLKRTWAELTGWGYSDEEHGGERRAVCKVDSLYYYESARARARDERTHRGAIYHQKTFKEFGKYVCSPKAPAELAARFALSLRHRPRSWNYGCFFGLAELGKKGELMTDGAPAGALRLPDGKTKRCVCRAAAEELPEFCAHCGTLHPRRRCTPFLDTITGALAFGHGRAVLELLAAGEAHPERGPAKAAAKERRERECARGAPGA